MPLTGGKPADSVFGTTYHRSLVAQMVKRLPTMRQTRVRSLVRKILWRRQWQPTPVLLPGKSHARRSLVGYSPWGHKESDTTEHLHFHFLSPQILVGASQVLGFSSLLLDLFLLPLPLISSLQSLCDCLLFSIFTQTQNIILFSYFASTCSKRSSVYGSP